MFGWHNHEISELHLNNLPIGIQKSIIHKNVFNLNQFPKSAKKVNTY